LFDRSGAFSLSELGQFSVQLRDEVSPRLYFLRLRFEIAYGIYLIKVTEELSEPLFQIENYLPDGILVQQKVRNLYSNFFSQNVRLMLNLGR
jgi:hypothetical protein